jgi:hypothetical protein
MAFGTRVIFDSVREKNAGDITGSYTVLGVPLTDHVRLLDFNNNTDQEIYISFDGVNDHLRFAQNSFKLFDLSANKIRDDGLFVAAGTQIYVKYVSTTTLNGAFWVEVMYGEGGK